MNKLAQLSDRSIDRVSMAFNNIPGQSALQSANGQPRDTPANMLQQNMPIGFASPQQRPQPPQQQDQRSLNFQQQQQQIQHYFFQQHQQLQQLQLQLQAQENNPQQNQSQLPYTAQQIAMARQSLLAQQQQQLTLLAQQYQQQQQLHQQSQAQSLPQSLQPDMTPNAASIPTSVGASAAMSPAHTVANLAASAVPAGAPIGASISDDGRGRAGAGVNGVSSVSSPAPNLQHADSTTLAMLRATAAKFGIPENALTHLTPNQLHVFLSNLQAQHSQQQHHGSQSQTPVSSASGMLSPQRQLSDSALPTGISGSNGNGTPTKAGSSSSSIPRPKSARSKKSVARDRSISRSPAPSQNQSQPQLFIPTALHIPQQSPSALGSPMGFVNSPRPMGNQNTIQRKSSMASIAADDARATPTPSESSVGGPAGGQTQHVTYTAEEVANAHKKSDEFLKQLPGFTSENFVEFLQKFLKDNDISGNFSKPPVFGDKTIDLYRFFCEVVKQGGLEQVHVRRVWRQVAKDSGLPDIPTLPPLLSRWYKVWLQPLEQLAVYPPGHPKHTGISANFSLKKRRKPDTFGSPGSTPGPIERPYSVNPDSSKRPKMYSPITNGAASATASPAPFTPPPPLSISSSAIHLPTGLTGAFSAQTASAPLIPTNGFTPTPTRSLPPQMPVPIGHAQPGAAGSAAGVVVTTAIANPSVPQHHSQPQQSEITRPQSPSIPLITVPPPPPAPQPLRFFPLERTLDTHGGIDIQASTALRPRVLLPSVNDYGSVDIRALTLSIESGIVMEVTAALNTLIQITSHPEVVVPLSQCEELAEALFSIIDNVKLASAYATSKQEPDATLMHVDPINEAAAGPQDELAVKYLSYSEEADLFDALYTNNPDEGGIIGDDMQDPTSVCGLIHGNDDLWSFTSDRTLTVVYALRNMSFVQMNQQYLSTSSDFLHMFRSVLQKCDYAVQAAQGRRDSDKRLSEKMASLVILRALEFRKSMMVILVNVADRISLQTAGKDFVDSALRLIRYFMDEKQTNDIVEEWMRESTLPALGAALNDPLASVLHVQAHDGRTYYLHALEALGRMTVSDDNRELLVGSASPDAYWPFASACISLLAGNQAAVSLNPNTVQNFTENRLMWVQMALVVFSNLVCTVTPQPLVASRRYTPFKISPSGVVGGPAHVNGMSGIPDSGARVNGIMPGAASPASGGGGSRRTRTRRTLPFVPVVYTATAVPAALKEFRERLVANDNVVRSLFEMVFMWWMHVGAAVNLRTNQGPLSPSAPYDSPLNDIAERAVYVLQQLHPEHDSLFTARWSEWVVERATRIPLCPELTEVLYELTGMLPVQSASFAKSS